jgi:hypothetical protein
MGWEARPGGRYYYRSVRVGGRVVKRYFGNGEVARQAERLDAEARRRGLAEAGAIRAEEDRLGPADAAMAALDRACRLMTGATLLASGFHQHCRSWRRNALQGRG